MSTGLNKFTENIVYRANIFNYDSKFFDEFSKGPQSLDPSQLRDISFDNATKKLSDLNRFLGYQVIKQFEELNSLANLLHETDSDTNNLEVGGISNPTSNQRKYITSKDAKLVIQIIIDILNCSINVLHKNEKERIDNQHKTNVNLFNDQKQYSEKTLGNITYCLLFLDGVLMYNIDLAGVFELLSLNVGVRFYDILNNLLESNIVSDSTKEIASHILSASMVFSVNTKFVSDDYNKIIDWSYNYNVIKDKSKDNCLTSNLVLILSNDTGLDCFIENFKHKRIFQELFEVLGKEHSINTIYESLVCIWNISNSERYRSYFEERNNKYLERIIQIIKTNKVEKIIRIGSLILKNLLNSDKCVEMLIDYQFLKTTKNLLCNKWSDENIKDELTFIMEFLEKNNKYQNSFEKYKKEVDDNKIRQGYLHTSEFWEENFKLFEYDNFEYIGKLIKILDNDKGNDEDIETKCIACFDIGEFARLYPAGPETLNYFNAKEILLKLISHSNLNLKNKALVCLQKLMMKNSIKK